MGRKKMKIKDIVVMQPDVEVPFHVWTLFSEQCKQVQFAGDQLSFGEDYMDLDSARSAIEWYVDQLGGKVKWSKK